MLDTLKIERVDEILNLRVAFSLGLWIWIELAASQKGFWIEIWNGMKGREIYFNCNSKKINKQITSLLK